MTEDMNYDKGDHYANSMDPATPGVQMAGDVVEMPQTMAQKLSGNIAQSVNERRTGSNLKNVLPIKRPGQ